MTSAPRFQDIEAARRLQFEISTSVHWLVVLGLALHLSVAMPSRTSGAEERVSATQIVILSDDIRNTTTEVVHNAASDRSDASDGSPGMDDDSSGGSTAESGDDSSGESAGDGTEDAPSKAKAKAKAERRAKAKAEAKARAEARKEAKAAAKAKAKAFAKARASSRND